MRATFKAPARIPLSGWDPAARAAAEAELRSQVVELALGAGADIDGPVEVPVTWRRDDELWRDPDGPHDAPLQTRTVMVGEAVLEADVDDDGAPGWVSEGLARFSESAAAAVFGTAPGGVKLESTGKHVTALGLDAERRADTRVCGSPERRHQFPRHEAIAMRDGLLTSSVCGDCGRRVSRDELLRNAELEAADVAWWTA